MLFHNLSAEKMKHLICRTCLKINLTKKDCIKISTKVEFNQMAVKDMLEIFMPEMDLDISDGETVICLQCAESLKNAYVFKNTCLKTEEMIYDYLHRYNIELGKKISLLTILDDNNINYNINTSKDLKSSSNNTLESANQFLNYGLSDSNQSSPSNFIEIESENEEKQEVKSRRTRRSKRTSSSKKSKKNYDYNSLKRSYTCDLCEYKAYRLDLLDTHKKKHDKNILSVKEFKCELCLYSTTRKRALDRHLFTHQGKSQHLCGICQKPFAEKYQLRLHTMTHTGQELPHKCKECGKSYLTKSYLKQHMETRHLSKEKMRCDCNEDDCEHLVVSRYYKCNLCRSSFSDKRGLDAHKFTHSGGELPFKCLHCNFSTAWKGNLKKHMKNKH